MSTRFVEVECVARGEQKKMLSQELRRKFEVYVKMSVR